MEGNGVHPAPRLNVHLHPRSGGVGSDAGLWGEVGRLDKLPRAHALGALFPVADTWRSRLLGLAGLSASQSAPGLLIPRCSSVHTFGMRFPLDVYFLGHRGEIVAARLSLPPRRIVREREAAAVLELPTGRP